MSVFAETPFADFGGQVSVDDGWINVPEADCDEGLWVKRPSGCVEAVKVDKAPPNWTVIK